MKAKIHSKLTRLALVFMFIFGTIMTVSCFGNCFAEDEINLDNFTNDIVDEEPKMNSLVRRYGSLSYEVVETSSQDENAVKNQILDKIANTFTRPTSVDEVKNIFAAYIAGPKEEIVPEVPAEEPAPKVVEDSEVSSSGNEEVVTSGEELIEVEEEGENIVIPEGVPANYVKVMDVTATAYCLCVKCCGKSPSSPGYGATASGLRIIPGTGMKVIAVDPKVVKLGTYVYVEGLNGVQDYGYAIAADTGGAIKNNKIDLYFDTHAECIKWGRRTVRLYILPD